MFGDTDIPKGWEEAQNLIHSYPSKLEFLLKTPGNTAKLRSFAQQSRVEENIDFLTALQHYQATVAQLNRYSYLPPLHPSHYQKLVGQVHW
jgi:hypothetical protein